MSENKELDKRVALAMGLKHEPDQAVRFHKSDHHSYIEYTDIFTLNGSLVETAEEWLPTTDPAAWHVVKVWMRDRFGSWQWETYLDFLIRELDLECTLFSSALEGGRRIRDVPEEMGMMICAPLVTCCRAFLAAVEGGDRME